MTPAGQGLRPAPWERAAAKFLAPWKHRRDVEGAVITGSRVLGLATPRSDIDIMLVFGPARKKVSGEWRAGGLLIECYSFTPADIRTLFEQDRTSGVLLRARLFGFGRIAFDRRGTVARIQAEARSELRRGIPPMPKRWFDMAKRVMRDRLGSMEELFEKRSMAFWTNYHVALANSVAQPYARFLRAEIPPVTRWGAFLTSAEFRRRYGMAKFPDARFAALLARALRARRRGEARGLLRSLVAHALRHMGGFKPIRRGPPPR